jgi:hypothetical protein
MNNHWKIQRTTKNQTENDFSKKVGFHTQIGEVSQPDNREITRLVGLQIRWRSLEEKPETQIKQ